jgi:hypothetical protein
MSEKPILFSGVMVRAILDGRKTVTRRILKDVPPPPAMDAIHPNNHAKHPEPYFDSYCGDRKTALNPRGMSDRWCWWTRDDRQCLPTVKVRWVPGDRLWVRETFSGLHVYDEYKWPPSAWSSANPIWYWADGNPPDGDWTKPRPSIHMPRWASRITLLVTGVQVERLQDITEADAWAEGVWNCGETDGGRSRGEGRSLYRSLWDHINGTGSWEANPWVVVVSFHRVEQSNV